ncbi:MAG: hypothetical protein J6W81_08130 [Lentisphaeria bacterium]|nr:hypothetical protein [Lentisphaeria bacterium]
MIRFFTCLILLAGVLVFTAGCSSEQTPKPGKYRKNNFYFPKLKDYSLQLSLLTSRREYYAGEENVVLTFSLKNTGLKPVTIAEWYAYEPANIKLFYRPGGTENNSEKWLASPTFDPQKRSLQNRSPLTLKPSTTQALVQVPAAFLKKLNNKNGKKVTYSIYAELNLHSVTVKSIPAEIYIK